MHERNFSPQVKAPNNEKTYTVYVLVRIRLDRGWLKAIISVHRWKLDTSTAIVAATVGKESQKEC